VHVLVKNKKNIASWDASWEAYAPLNLALAIIMHGNGLFWRPDLSEIDNLTYYTNSSPHAS